MSHLSAPPIHLLVCKYLSDKNHYPFAVGVPQSTREIAAELQRQMAHDQLVCGDTEEEACAAPSRSRCGGSGRGGGGGAGGMGTQSTEDAKSTVNARLMKDHLTPAELNAYVMTIVRDTFLSSEELAALKGIRGAEERRLLALARERAGLVEVVKKGAEQIKVLKSAVKAIEDDAKLCDTPQACATCERMEAPMRCSRCGLAFYCDVRCQKVRGVGGVQGGIGRGRRMRRPCGVAMACGN